MTAPLTAGQRAALAVEDGGRPEHAEKHGAPYSVVKLARVVRERSPGTFAELRAGRLGVTKAHKIATTGSARRMMVPLESVRTDGGTQPRAALHPSWVEEYALDMMAGAEFPPVVVFFDGTDHWLADGFHRYRGAESLGLAEIAADVRQGTRRDAILFSVGANATHGMRRTNEDKRRAVLVLLGDAEWSGWSNREVAKRCGVDDKTVAALRPKPSAEVPQTVEPRKFERGGKVHEMRTGGINAGRPPRDPFEREPEPRAVDEGLAPEPPRADPEKQEAFSLASEVGGRLRDLERIMGTHPAGDVAWAVGASPLGTPDRFLARARGVAAWLGEIINLLEREHDQAA